MSDARIMNAILAGFGAEDDAAISQAERAICSLERAGFKIIPRAQYEALIADAALAAERDAISAKTIEECDMVLFASGFPFEHPVRKKIRALATSKEEICTCPVCGRPL